MPAFDTFAAMLAFVLPKESGRETPCARGASAARSRSRQTPAV